MAEQLLESEVMDAAEFREAVERHCADLGLDLPPPRESEADEQPAKT